MDPEREQFLLDLLVDPIEIISRLYIGEKRLYLLDVNTLIDEFDIIYHGKENDKLLQELDEILDDLEKALLQDELSSIVRDIGEIAIDIINDIKSRGLYVNFFLFFFIVF
jgi:hypothetical protein